MFLHHAPASFCVYPLLISTLVIKLFLVVRKEKKYYNKNVSCVDLCD